MRPPFTPLPSHLFPLYQKLRITLALVMLIGLGSVAYIFLFPTIITSFDFRNPQSSKNQIFDPRSETHFPRLNGKIEAGGTLFANTSPLGDFSQLSISIDLEKKSESPNEIEVAVRRNYRAFLLPLGETITDFPSDDVYRVEDTYYRLSDGILHPFVSEAAFLTRFPAARATRETSVWRSRYPVAADFIGFRVGSLISFADGIYVVVSESEVRPIGSAEIFLALGYHFEDVVPVDEEALGMYTRGRIILMGTIHPDGTLFEERGSDTLSLIVGGQRRPISPGKYRDFLRATVHPILAGANDTEVTRCTATTGLLPRAFDCTASLAPLADALGPDYEIRLSNNTQAIDIATLTTSFETRLGSDNFRTLLSKVKQRVLSRFGFTTL